MFFEEARELVQALESGLMELEARQGDREHLDRTFRAAHTLKGAAGMVGLAEISRFTHSVEAVLDKIRAGALGVSPGVISTLLEACDHLAAAVDAAAEHRSLSAPENLSERLSEIAQGQVPVDRAQTQKSEPSCREPAPQPESTPERYRIVLSPGRDALRNGLDPLGILDELCELGQAEISADCQRVPGLAELEPEDCYIAWQIELQTTVERSRLDEAFLFLHDSSQVTIEPVSAGASEQPAPHRAEPQPARAAPSPVPATQTSQTKSAPAARIRVEADQLDQLVSMAGELAILTDSLMGLREIEGATRWASGLESLERVAHRLRDTTLELRMVPVEELFVRFPRVVRDLAERSGKQIELRILGEDTKLDRTIVERLAEPMIHLIRNSIDHGLERPEERLAAGKAGTGRITISAGHEGDRVAIRVSDDGRGLDRARIARKGMAVGLLPPETAPDDPRVTTVIFEPGFSTRERVGELSGRGVGLDVVRDTIRALRGSVSVRSEPNRGTVFLIRLPLTLAMIDGLLVEAIGGRFVVPMSQVEECVAVSADNPGWAMSRRSLVVRDELVPVVSLHESRGDEPVHQELLLTRHAEQRVGVAVDRLLGRVQALIQPLDESLAGLRRFSGSTVLSDGSICLILDLATVISEARASAHREMAASFA
jgi:two-component system chemotaxis sensor kinase CheA